MLHRIPSIDKIAAAIGWEPTLDLDVILADVIKYIQTNGPRPLPETEAIET